MYSHVGWIPCINGHLDFGLMVPGIQGSFTTNELSDLKTSKINYGFLKQQNHHARRIVLQSKVDWRDTKNDSHDGSFRVILLAEAIKSEDLDNRVLKGEIFIYPLALEPELTQDGKIELPWFDKIHSMNKALEQYKANSSEILWENTRSSLNALYSDTLIALGEEGPNQIRSNFFRVAFIVDPHGFTELRFVQNQVSNLSQQQKYVLLRQAFYYIKYSLHSHKHHYAKEDSLTTIVPIDSPSKGPSKVEALKMLGQLKRELTNIKRTYSNGGNKVYGEEQGIIAYMNSLCASLRSKNYLDEDIFKRETLYLSSLSKSFSVQVEKREKKEKCTDDIKSVYRVYVAWALSLISVIWLTSFRGFFEYPDNLKVTVNFSILEHVVIILTVLASAYLTYRYRVNRKIKNTIDEKGFISWVEKNYTVSDEIFNKHQNKRILKFTIVFIMSFLSIFLLEMIINYLVNN